MANEDFDSVAELKRLSDAAGAYGNVAAGSLTDLQAEKFAADQAFSQVQGPDILLMGAATGAWLELLLASFDGFEVVDAVEPIVAALVASAPDRIKGHCVFFEHFSPTIKYDTIIMGHILEHVQDPVLLLGRVRSWLKPKGRIVILVPNSESIHRLVGLEMGFLAKTTDFSAGDISLGHRRVYNQGTLAMDVERAGLEVQLMEGAVLKPLSNAQMDQWSDELRRSFFSLGKTIPNHACVLICVAT
jgi:2-polyprenyl-3-methyl-5-hydroxy-6-metoxy-1,4-benzoquinol methylase